MSYTKDELMEFIEENDVKFVRLVFCDILGEAKNVAVMADYLPAVLESGAGFDASSVDGFMNIAESDLLLHPIPATLATLPWRPQSGRVARMYCDIRHPGGQDFEGDGRPLLRAARKAAEGAGLAVRAHTKCEFYLFEQDDAGRPTLRPHDGAGYLDIAPRDKCENVRREICLALEQMGVSPKGSHHERGPGQNEIWCRDTDVLACADDLLTYKTVVRTIAAQNGLFACFMPSPLADTYGSGMHVNLSLAPAPGAGAVEEAVFESFVAGILAHIGEITLFTNTATNSYARLGRLGVPSRVSWTRGNRSHLIRVPAGSRDRLELRSPDPLCNPYLVLTLLLHAGLEGIEQGATPPEAGGAESSAEEAGFAPLPKNLGEAIEAAQNSVFIRKCLPAAIIDKTIELKRREWEQYGRAKDKAAFEHENYFERI